jgi:hypothetical protein
MFLYSKYAIYTDVKTAVLKRTEIIYPSTDMARKNETATEYFFESANHRELTRSVQVNSDNSRLVTRFKYASDYPVANAGDVPTAAIQNLLSAHRTDVLVESITSRVDGAVEKFNYASLQTFQVL